MMSTNAAIVVVFQFWISRKVGKKNPFLMMALGTAFYLAGYTAFGHVHAFYLILLAVIVITIGEMIMVPVQMAITAKLSPPEMRGRYMAASNLSWSIPAVAGLLRQ
jgi:MFS family permease